MAEGAPPAGGPPPGGAPPPPWLNFEAQTKVAYRDNDVIISVPIKSGTTWSMNIVYQIRQQGRADFVDIYQEVPWLEFAKPGETTDDLVKKFDAMPADVPRAFKTHAAPPMIPFIKQGEGPNVKYLVVARNPEEALVSFYPFLKKHNPEFIKLYGLPENMFNSFPSFEVFMDVIGGTAMGMLFGFIKGWWDLRHEPNVLFLHFNEMKKDHEGSVRKIADFLGEKPEEEKWKGILEYTSFPWMKKHERKFESTTVIEPHILLEGAMIRKGQSGSASEDGMTPALSAKVKAFGEQMLTPDALEWFYKGGPLPK